MFRTSQEFTFSINQDDYKYSFTGQMVFEGKELNENGTIHTEEEFEAFGAILNDSLMVPEFWTLEILAMHIFSNAKPVFKNLKSVNLFITDYPQRVAEYSSDAKDLFTGNDILQLEEIA